MAKIVWISGSGLVDKNKMKNTKNLNHKINENL